MAMPRVSQFSISAKKRALLVSVIPNPHPFPYSKEPTSYISGDKRSPESVADKRYPQRSQPKFLKAYWWVQTENDSDKLRACI